ncbi:DUF294 nucleotidyltransferase-like domain-containing protein [Paenibacillus macerans]|uniref:DUF294 nucleotidyltransferase-like domain-containing protein n=1 Tax=Paenibacillus macerans TaxID=44252 RepID=UPI002042199E|nr:DUF294 nucleotidyltransferase-like domain-containing protein [Paenibacillus macerans]MCM3699836.1 DUF294 nucleotidyltransferase-like domain-containing protein [Paenibacillus macerans]
MSHETAMNNGGLQAIRSASSPGLLRSVRIEEQNVLHGRFASMPILEWNRAVGEMHDAVMGQACQLCEEMLRQEGFGPPPSHYAFVAFGSAGRAEQTLWSDQDNGLIYGDGDEAENAAYFEAFGNKLSQVLEQVGYPPCPGNVMLSNPLWRGDLSRWERQFMEWREALGWEHVRYLMIASDMRHIYGDQVLSGVLRKTMKRVMELDQGTERDVIAAVLRNTVRHKAALNILGQVITEPAGEHAGDFDVKYGLYIPIVNAVRYFALQYGIETSSTWERISQLYQLEAVPARWLESCRKAFATAVKFRSIVPPKLEDGMLTGTHYLPQAMIKQKELRRELRESLSTVRLMYRTLQRQHRYAERKWL